MRQPSRVAGLVAGLVLLSGCGGSLADTDPRSTRAEPPAPASPFCAATQDAAAAVRPLNALLSRGADTGELQELIPPVRRANQEVVRAAPGEIRIDVERSIEAATIQLDALEAGGPAALDEELAARLGAPEYTEAAERVRSYVATNC